VVSVAAGRTWRRPTAGAAVDVAYRARHEADGWLRRIDDWHEAVLDELGDWPDHVAGCVVDELGLVTSLGTAWVHGDGEHFGLLEGFDDGYFYYDTADLWHYAFPALSLTWPRLADLVFADLGAGLT